MSAELKLFTTTAILSYIAACSQTIDKPNTKHSPDKTQ